jgi:hypothetical protein
MAGLLPCSFGAHAARHSEPAKIGQTREYHKVYQAALKRLPVVVEALDGGKDSPRNFGPWKQMAEGRSGSLPVGVRSFLLTKLF